MNPSRQQSFTQRRLDDRGQLATGVLRDFTPTLHNVDYGRLCDQLEVTRFTSPTEAPIEAETLFSSVTSHTEGTTHHLCWLHTPN